MNLVYWSVTKSIKGITQIFCKIDATQLEQVPEQGPLLLVCNHVNFLDVPVVYPRLVPRPIAAYSKVESWDSPWMGKLFDLWGGIPLHRGEVDMIAMRKGLDALSAGKILVVTPEGTRSGNGCLLPGHAGIITLAIRSGAPLLPMVFFGFDDYRQDYKKLRRPEFHIRVGKPFHLRSIGNGNSRAIRQQMLNEVMYQLAALLPPVYRGAYSDLTQASSDYLEFISLEK